MCFSATASFVTATALTPIGAVAVAFARQRDSRRWLPLALTPLLFAIQQALEGSVWLQLDHATPAALAYLGFAFALWPIWMPWCALRLSAKGASPQRRRLLQCCLGLGWLVAAALWIPLLLDPGRIHPAVRHGSIDYQVWLPWSAHLGHGPGSLIYALIICLPLLLSSSRRLPWLAAALALAFAWAQLAFLHAFSSVWCYFSAVLSALVLWILQEEPATTQPPRAF